MSRALPIGLSLALACAASAVRGQGTSGGVAPDAVAQDRVAQDGIARGSGSRPGPFREGFEGPQVRLGFLECDGPYRMESQQCGPGAHSGYQCEQLELQLGQGTKCYVGLAVAPARVIDELAVAIWLKCDQAGPQLLARITLPNTIDPRTNTAAKILVAGESYKDVGRWQVLRLGSLPDQVSRASRGLQGQFGPQAIIDTREAYLDYVLLNVHTGAGRVRLAVDDLEISAIVTADTQKTTLPVSTSVDAPPLTEPSRAAAPTRRPDVRCQGSEIIVSERPIFVRAIQYQGESLEFLKRLGFNAVQLDQSATPELLSEAGRLGLWVISPPPNLGDAPIAGPFGAIGPQWDPVLAWDLGQGLSAPQFDWYCQEAKRLRQTDRGPQSLARPIICDPLTDCRAFSRHADILRPSRRPLGSTLELADYGIWLRERPHLARPGVALWTTIQTQPSAEYVAQAQALVPGTVPRACAPLEQIRLLTYLSVASGARGLLFESRARLDAQDIESRRRAMTLELVNLELNLIEPWAAAGSLVSMVSGTPFSPANSDGPPAAWKPAPLNQSSPVAPQVVGGLLQIEKARLLLPMWLGKGGQFATGQAAASDVALVVPGVPPGHDGYELSPTGMQRLDQRRATRGLRVTLRDFGVATMVVFTDDPIVLRSLTERISRSSERAAKLQQDLAQIKLLQVEQLQQQMAAINVVRPFAAQYVALARSMLQQTENAVRGRDFERAYRAAESGMRPLRLLERAYWDQAVEGQSPTSSPLTADVGTLPQHAWLTQRLAGASWSPNLLPAGDCESVEKMRAAGWRLSSTSVAPTISPSPGSPAGAGRASEEPGRGAVRAGGEVAPGNAHAGGYSVRMMAQAADPRSPPDLVESPPVWLSTPPVPVPVGSIVKIRGWVRVPAPITASLDGVMIFDSLGGPGLAVRIDAPAAAAAAAATLGSDAWQPFTLLGAVRPETSPDGRASPLVVTFALTGLGEAWVDDVTVECTQDASR